MFQFVNSEARLLAHELSSILVSEIIASFDRIERMSLPAVIFSIGIVSQGSIDPSLSSHRMRAQRMDLGDNSYGEAGIAGQSCRKPSQPTPNNQDVVT
jgi:hypothetical protein